MPDSDRQTPECGASLAVVPFKDYGAEVRYLCILPADGHEWHADRFRPDFQWRATESAASGMLVGGPMTQSDRATLPSDECRRGFHHDCDDCPCCCHRDAEYDR